MPLIRKDTVAAEPATPALEASRAMLLDGTPDERWRAARALTGVPGGVPALAAALARETDTRVREVIFTGLARTGTAECVDVLLPYLHSDDASLRTGALDALQTMPDRVAAKLPELLADPDPDVRLLSSDLARGLPVGDATRLICDLLEREDQPNVCAAAVDVLADIGDAQALPTLERCAARFSQSPFLVFAIEIAVKRIRKPSDANRG